VRQKTASHFCQYTSTIEKFQSNATNVITPWRDNLSDPSHPPRGSLESSPYSGGQALHWVALLTAFATLLLIFLGGLVTSHQAGMSVPDWPNSYGYNMFLFPPSDWVGGILYEHTHRLLASVVGFCAVVLTLIAWGPSQRETTRRLIRNVALICGAIALGAVLVLAIGSSIGSVNPAVQNALSQAAIGFAGIFACAGVAYFCRSPKPRWLRWLAVSVLAAVILQGVLGGLRVVLVKLDLAIIHACVAQAFFCLAAFMALATSRWWYRSKPLPDRSSGRPLLILGAVTVAAIYLQLIVGATMRHYQAGLAIPDLPLAYGKLLPPVDQVQLDAANAFRVRMQPPLDSVTLGQIWLHYGHRIGAVLVTLAVLALAGMVIGRYRHRPQLIRPAVLLIVLLAAQLTLGVLTVVLRKPADIASAHVAVGALVLVTSFWLTASAARIYRWQPRSLNNREPAGCRREAKAFAGSSIRQIPGEFA
jgi:heme a synthase